MIILDRYEGEYALVEIDGKIKKLPRDMFNDNIPEGSVLKLCGNIYKVDEESTESRRKKLSDLQNSLFE